MARKKKKSQITPTPHQNEAPDGARETTPVHFRMQKRDWDREVLEIVFQFCVFVVHHAALASCVQKRVFHRRGRTRRPRHGANGQGTDVSVSSME